MRRVELENHYKGLSISIDEKIDYYNRLIRKYNKKGEEKLFIEQYLNGSGSELLWKFWSLHSSSRLAFESYSWLANSNDCLDIEFEKKLPGINGIKIGNPNMDVYIEKNDQRILIESKFLENSKNNKYSISSTYYKESEKYPLIKNYYFNDNLRSQSISFINDINKLVIEANYCDDDFFNVKQETTHLIGIAFKLNSDMEWFDKPLRFKNVVYMFNDDNSDKAIEFRSAFIKRGEEYIRKLYPNLDFSYGVESLMEFLKEGLLLDEKEIAFGEEKITVYEKIKGILKKIGVE